MRLGNHSPHLDKVRSGQPPSGLQEWEETMWVRGQGRAYSKHSGLLSTGEVGTPSCLASPGLGDEAVDSRGSDAEMGI